MNSDNVMQFLAGLLAGFVIYGIGFYRGLDQGRELK